MSRALFSDAKPQTGLLTALVLGAWFFYVLLLHEELILYLAYETVRQSGFTQMAAKIILDTGLVIAFFWSVPGLPKPRIRGAFFILLWVTLVVGAKDLTVYEALGAKTVMDALADSMGWGSLLVLGLAYSILLAIPFVPGVELGFMMIIFFGPRGALTAYLATFLGLMIAFSLGRLAPKAVIQNIRTRLNLRARSLVSSDENSAVGRNWLLSSRLTSVLWRFKPLLLGILLNLPGNAVVGGGGGIALGTGIGRFLSFRVFALTVLLATAPIPTLTAFGLLSAERMLEATGIGVPPPQQNATFPFGVYHFQDFTLTIDDSGHYLLERTQASHSNVKGSFKLEDSLIILHDEAGAMACSGSATRGEYWWNLSQGHITFERVHDFCRLRAWFLDRARLNVAENTGLY